MSESLSFESPITSSYPAAEDDGLIIVDRSSLTKVIVRAGTDTAAAQALAVPFGASRTSGGSGSDILICGQRPTEWLLLGDPAAVGGFVASLDRSGHVSTIDHTHSRALFRLTGTDGPQLLAKVCSLDWGNAMTPDGAVVSASVARVNCDIVRNDDGGDRSFLLACDRSFAQYLFDVLLDAGQEFGIGVGAGADL